MNPLSALNRLAGMKTTYGPGCGSERLPLLRIVARARFRTSAEVAQLHELLCFLHAYPDDARVFAQVHRMLRAFDVRADVRRWRTRLVNSGVAGADIVYPFGFSTARWLASRCGRNLTIEWNDVGNLAALEGRLQLFSAWAERPVFDEPPLEGRAWLDRLRGRETDAEFVIRRSAALPVRGMANDHLYDELGLTLRVTAGPGTPNRTRSRVPAHAVVPQPTPLRLARPDLLSEIRVPPRRIRRIGQPEARQLLDLARESMVTRSRDLYTFTAANLRDARLVDCGDGLEFFCIGVEPEQRLLLDTVYGILTLRNGVPIGYALFSALWRSSEVAYNVFESFRGGESAWVYGRLLATIHAMFGADTFTVDPYQLGHENDEGLDSGAWWFYYKLGFTPWDPATARLARAESAKVASRRGYRTNAATLRRLVRFNVFLQLGESRADVIGAIPTDRIGLKVTDYLTTRFGSDRERATVTLADEAAERLGAVRWRRLPPGEKLFWERWAPLVALLPGIDRWSAQDKRDLAAVIRAKGSRVESDFVARFDAHPRIGAALAALARRE
ncbi:MAG: hypothetical protein NTY02_06540 [Acidobacteria bacterium]|nr:hypothetical protein [Acidobacteriota bacterium]